MTDKPILEVFESGLVRYDGHDFGHRGVIQKTVNYCLASGPTVTLSIEVSPMPERPADEYENGRWIH